MREEPPLVLAAARQSTQGRQAEEEGEYKAALEHYTAAIEHVMEALAQLAVAEPKVREELEERGAKLMERAEQVKLLAKKQQEEQRSLPLTKAGELARKAQQAQAQGDCSAAFELYRSAISSIQT